MDCSGFTHLNNVPQFCYIQKATLAVTYKIYVLMTACRKYWAKGWSGLDVGHRGLGNSYTQVKTWKIVYASSNLKKKFTQVRTWKIVYSG